VEITECGSAIDLVLGWIDECITEMSVTLNPFDKNNLLLGYTTRMCVIVVKAQG